MANANHVLIGLGGTGGKIIRSFRKAIYQNYRVEQPKGANIRYLYVDSSDEMMKHDDPTWKILGQSVQLPLSNQLPYFGSQSRERIGQHRKLSRGGPVDR